jgi:hypothetical protein
MNETIAFHWEDRSRFWTAKAIENPSIDTYRKVLEDWGQLGSGSGVALKGREGPLIGPFSDWGEDKNPEWFRRYSRFKHDRFAFADRFTMGAALNAFVALYLLLEKFAPSGWASSTRESRILATDRILWAMNRVARHAMNILIGAVGSGLGFVGSLFLLVDVADFLPDRTAFLDGEGSNLLVPYRNMRGEIGGWPESSLRKLMSDLSKASGIHVRLQEFRATFGQRAIDRGASVQAVSRCMRHKTTVTTERYYARMRPDDAMDEVRGVLNRLVKVAPKN